MEYCVDLSRRGSSPFVQSPATMKSGADIVLGNYRDMWRVSCFKVNYSCPFLYLISLKKQTVSEMSITSKTHIINDLCKLSCAFKNNIGDYKLYDFKTFLL